MGDRPPRSRLVGAAFLVGVALLTSGCLFSEPPAIDAVTIEPAALNTNSSARAQVVAHDPRGGQLSYLDQWTRNGDDIPDAAAATLDLSRAGVGARGDAIAVRIVAVRDQTRSKPKASAPSTVAAAITFSMPESRESYPVEGTDTAALFASIRANGLSDGTPRASGLTRFLRMNRTLQTVEKNDSCAIDSLTIENAVVVTLPKIVPAARSADLQAKVERFGAAVLTHEERHVSIRREHLDALMPLLLAIRPAPTCDVVERSIDRAVQTMLDSDKQDQDLFHQQEAARIEAACAPLEAQLKTLAATLLTLRSQPAQYNALVSRYNAVVDDRNWCAQS